MKVVVRLEGDAELRRKLLAAGVAPKKVLRTAVLAGAAIVEGAANGMAPAPEIDHAVMAATSTMCQVDVGPRDARWYWRFIEFGTGEHTITGKARLVFEGREGWVSVAQVQHPGMRARPFLRPAMDAKRDDAQGAMGAAWKTAIEAVA